MGRKRSKHDKKKRNPQVASSAVEGNKIPPTENDIVNPIDSDQNANVIVGDDINEEKPNSGFVEQEENASTEISDSEANLYFKNLKSVLLKLNISLNCLMQLKEENLDVDDFFSQLSKLMRTEFPLVDDQLKKAIIIKYSVANTESSVIDTGALCESMMNDLFHIEILEFQIRSYFSSRMMNTEFHKTVKKLFSLESSQQISLSIFEQTIKEQFNINIQPWYCDIIFSRIVHKVPNSYFAEKDHAVLVDTIHFYQTFQSFIKRKSFSMNSFEGKLRHMLSSNGDIKEKFERIDEDGSGSLSPSEFVEFLSENGIDLPKEVLYDFVDKFDHDGDGQLDYQEFLDFVSTKSFNLNILTPFGMINLSLSPNATMSVATSIIVKKLFWMQQTNNQNNSQRHHKLVDSFILSRHFGTIDIKYSSCDIVSSIFTQGELVFLIDPLDCPHPENVLERFENKNKAICSRPPLLKIPNKVSPTRFEHKEEEEFKMPIEKSSHSKVKTLRTFVTHVPAKKGMDLDFSKVMDWKSHDVRKWIIHRVSLPQFSVKFCSISGKELLVDVDEIYLRDILQISSALHRKKILTFIETLKQNCKIERKKKSHKNTKSVSKESSREISSQNNTKPTHVCEGNVDCRVSTTTKSDMTSHDDIEEKAWMLPPEIYDSDSSASSS